MKTNSTAESALVVSFGIITLLSILLSIAVPIGIIWAILHFVIKFW